MAESDSPHETRLCISSEREFVLPAMLPPVVIIMPASPDAFATPNNRQEMGGRSTIRAGIIGTLQPDYKDGRAGETARRGYQKPLQRASQGNRGVFMGICRSMPARCSRVRRRIIRI
jgi:hypothetical protein